MNLLRLGTRKSALAQVQANAVAQRLSAAFPESRVELVLITTTGDTLSSRPDTEGGLKALFTKEIEEALLDQRIDIAVHSLKDMAAELPQGLVLGAVPEREDARDVWISKTNLSFNKIPAAAKIGTGAVRRQAQLRHLRPDVQSVPIRGNVDTRLKKLAEGAWDGILLARAGLKRLGMEDKITEVLPMDLFLPAVGQGCLAIEVRENDSTVSPYLKALDHEPSRQAALAERSFLHTLGGSCQTPIAAHAEVKGDQLHMQGLVASLTTDEFIQDSDTGTASTAEAIGRRLALKLLVAGADKILDL